MDDTGTWFIATFEFGEFVRQKGTVVWATGHPGSGKTILASISIEHLEVRFSGRSDVAILYAFLRYSEKHTLLQIIAGLLAQLVRCHPVAFSHLLPTYKHADVHKDELSCSDAVKLLKSSLGLFSDTFIVIDGLDEVNDTTKDGLLKVLTSVHANILVTCRPLDLFMRRHTPRALHIPVQAQTRDIEVYVSERIKDSTRLASILAEHPDIAERFTALIQEKSKGMFLLAKLQMELVLERCATIGSLLAALRTLPSGINDMYHHTMDRISALSEEEVSIAHRAILWIHHARDELSPEDLQHALAFSYQDNEFVEDHRVSIPVLLSICCGLVTVEDGDLGKRVIRFIHYSTQEFMKGVTFSDLPDPHDLLAVTSVARVEPHMRMLTVGLKSEEWGSGVAASWDEHMDPLLRYAHRNWGHHAKICDNQHGLNPFIHTFLSKYSTYTTSDYHGHVSKVLPGLSFAAAHDLANLISSRILPYVPTHSAPTPFHISAQRGHTATLHALLKNYRGVNVKDESGSTPLHHCVSRRSQLVPDVARLLLHLSPSDTWRAFPSEVIDINAQDHDGCSAFFEACRNFNDLPIECLNDRTGPEGRILHLFASHPGIEVDLPDAAGDTPLSHACGSYRTSGVAQFLLSSIPTLKIDTSNKRGETPFMRACENLSVTVVNCFLSRDPGVLHCLQEDYEGKTALERIVAYDGETLTRNRIPQGIDGRLLVHQIIRILLQHASHVRMVPTATKHAEGLPSIYQVRASRAEQSPTFVCLEEGHRRYEDGRTALMLLVDYPVTLEYLVSVNLDNSDFINAQDSDGRCALMYACSGQVPASTSFSVHVLISHPSININLRDRTGMSALDYALCSENIHVLNQLLGHPSWDAPAIRNAVITAVQELKIHSKAIQGLLEAQQVQIAFSNNSATADATLLMAGLLHRADCMDILEQAVKECVFRCPSKGLFRTVSVRNPHSSGFVRWFSAEEWPY
ncbi:ankyrin repeat-containing domain protein [Ephemerocybe angulata]|uniref:Ankyrin repeat-containing domain protein n=1 Tax=Ephemerocybe angulata TaxID=980116 RepID=A0A8H6HVR6_9AGAR|nr:ankyrin repeat-containing domain protein [Tulosesus angulatus]